MITQLVNALEAARDMIQWMSGSADFAPEGKAHEGWKKYQVTIAQIDAAIRLAKEKA